MMHVGRETWTFLRGCCLDKCGIMLPFKSTSISTRDVTRRANIRQSLRRHEKIPSNALVSRYMNQFLYLDVRIAASYLNDDEFIKPETINATISALFGRIQEQKEIVTWMPHFSCPLPCEHKFHVWRNLFIASMILNVCLVIAVVPYIYSASKRDGSEALL